MEMTKSEMLKFGSERFAKTQEEYDEIVRLKLEESLAEAADPNTRWYTHEEVMSLFKEKFGYDFRDKRN